MDTINRKLTRSLSVTNWKPFDTQSLNNSGGSSWKFWRRFSFRSRGHQPYRSKANKDSSEVGQLSKADIGEPVDVKQLDITQSTTPVPGKRDLPDVLDRAHPLPVFNANAVPPPKPPRLFLVRSPSNGGSKSSSSESVAEKESSDKYNLSGTEDSGTYTNCERLDGLGSLIDSNGGLLHEIATSKAGENNNIIGKLSLFDVVEEEHSSDLEQALKKTERQLSSELKLSPHDASQVVPTANIPNGCAPVTNDADSKNNNVDNNNRNADGHLQASSRSESSQPPPLPQTQPPSIPSPSASPSRTRTTSNNSNNSSSVTNSYNYQYHSSTTPRKSKIVTPELSHKRYGRSRRKSSSDKNPSRQRLIMNSVMDLMCQRLDPYPLLDPLKRAGVLTNVHLQSFLGHRDRKSVCEELADVIGKGTPENLSVFCAVMASCPGNCTEILEILQVMREIDRIIYDIPQQTKSTNGAHGFTLAAAVADAAAAAADDSNGVDSSSVVEEKNLNFDIGYLSNDYSLKPLLELDRVRSSNAGESGVGANKRLSTMSSRNSSYSLLEGSVGSSATLNPATCGNVGLPSSSNHASDLVNFPGLVMMSISITGHSLTGEKSEALAEVIRSHNCISELRLGKTNLSGQDVTRLTQALAEQSSTIQSLDLRLNVIDGTGAEAVTQLLQQSRFLRVLNLSSTELDIQSFGRIVSAISGNKSLVEFDGSFLDLTDECCASLRDMLRANTTLQKLRLRGNNLTPSGCQTLCEGLARNIGLAALDLSRNPIKDAGVQALGQYLPTSHVTDVSVDGCGITSNGCQALAEVVTGCKKLKYLDVSTNDLGDAGVARLAPSLEYTSSLMAVSFNMCSVTNDGFSKLLDVMEKNTSIRRLKLCFNKLGDQHSNPAATSENLRYRLRIVLSSKPKLRILLWGNAFEES